MCEYMYECELVSHHQSGKLEGATKLISPRNIKMLPSVAEEERCRVQQLYINVVSHSKELYQVLLVQ